MKYVMGKPTVCAALAGLVLGALSVTATPAFAEMTVRDFILTTGVNDREPVDNINAVQASDGSGKVTIFARIKNTGEKSSAIFVWYKGDAERARKTVNIGASSGWRTWSLSAVDVGTWRVLVADGEGNVLAEKTFEVAGEAAPAMKPAAATPAASSEPAAAAPVAASAESAGGTPK